MNTPNALRYIDINDQYWICIDCQPLLKSAAELIAIDLEDVITDAIRLTERTWQTLPLDATNWQAELNEITYAWQVTHTSRHFIEITNQVDGNSKITIHQQFRTATLTR